ncbi:putative T7SS-secreted protein [Gordonia sp. AC31]|uniref:putative T7SS-secreted protein n=1 Tax=Gordonia sp. AC31 TaxID=2962571 RepID=UPI00288107D1|nr:RHS repeat-associated core domain-containing protein [Gordonia sp. AC31]MDT0223047.1 RHS repeat-associated core domain-containing protein [Gordonia sp. AC31]
MGLFDVFEGGKEVVGGLVDGATELLGGGLRAVGLDSIATNVEDLGDDVANSLGAMPDEKNLDETKDPKELILGDPAGITALADKFTGFAGNFVAAGEGLRGISVGNWSGTGAVEFRDASGRQVPQWFAAGDAASKAAAALAGWAGVVTFAQQKAAEAVRIWEEGERKHAEWVTKANIYNDELDDYKHDRRDTPPTHPGPDPWPGYEAEAERVLKVGRDHRNSSAPGVKAELSEAANMAPPMPSAFDQARMTASDVGTAAFTSFTHFEAGLIGSVTEVVKGLNMMLPQNPYNIANPHQYMRNSATMATGIVHQVAHPDEFVRNFAGSGWSTDPSQALGNVIGNTVMMIAPGPKGGGLLTGFTKVGRNAPTPSPTPHINPTPRHPGAPPASPHPSPAPHGSTPDTPAASPSAELPGRQGPDLAVDHNAPPVPRADGPAPDVPAAEPPSRAGSPNPAPTPEAPAPPSGAVDSPPSGGAPEPPTPRPDAGSPDQPVAGGPVDGPGPHTPGPETPAPTPNPEPTPSPVSDGPGSPTPGPTDNPSGPRNLGDDDPPGPSRGDTTTPAVAPSGDHSPGQSTPGHNAVDRDGAPNPTHHEPSAPKPDEPVVDRTPTRHDEPTSEHPPKADEPASPTTPHTRPDSDAPGPRPTPASIHPDAPTTRPDVVETPTRTHEHTDTPATGPVGPVAGHHPVSTPHATPDPAQSKPAPTSAGPVAPARADAPATPPRAPDHTPDRTPPARTTPESTTPRDLDRGRPVPSNTHHVPEPTVRNTPDTTPNPPRTGPDDRPIPPTVVPDRPFTPERPSPASPRPASPDAPSSPRDPAPGNRPDGDNPDVDNSAPDNDTGEPIDPAHPERTDAGSTDRADTSEGNEAPEQCRSNGEPVNVATGEYFLPLTDVDLPGVLPLRLTHRHRSRYRWGRWLGPTTPSTFDARAIVGDDLVTIVDADGTMTNFPKPQDDSESRSVNDTDWELRATATDGYQLTHVRTLVSWFFIPIPELDGVDVTAGSIAVSAMTDRHHNRIRFVFDEHGRPSAVEHSAGYRIEVQCDSARILGYRLVAGVNGVPANQQLCTFTYHRGHLAASTNAVGATTRFGYDDAGRMTWWRDSIGMEYWNRYDDLGRVTIQSGMNGVWSGRFDYQLRTAGPGSITTYTDAVGATTLYGIDADNRVRQEIDALGRITRTDYNDSRQPMVLTGADGLSTRLHYNAFGDVERIVGPDGAATEVSYAGPGRPDRIVEPGPVTTRIAYTDNGSPLTVTDNAGAVTSYTYDEHGALTSLTDPDGVMVRYRNNAAGLPTEIVDVLGNTTRIRFDAFGRPVEVVDAEGARITVGYDAMGNRTSLVAPDGGQSRWEYDGEGNCAAYVDPVGATTRWEYGHYDLPVARIDADGSRTAFTYDTARRLVAVTNPDGLVWSYSYNADGSLQSEVDFNNATTTYAYDAGGRLATRTNAAGQTVAFEYDAAGRVVAERSSDPLNPVFDGEVTEYSYDLAGRPESVVGAFGRWHSTYTAAGMPLLTGVNDGTGDWVIESGWTGAGRSASVTTPTAVHTRYGYDPRGVLDFISTAGRTCDITTDASGREQRRQFDGTAIDSSWDLVGRLVGRSVATVSANPSTLNLGSSGSAGGRPERTVARAEYTYRADGILTASTTTLADRGRTDYQVDVLGRITAAVSPSGTEQLTYDATGNITDYGISGSRSETRPPGAQDSGQPPPPGQPGASRPPLPEVRGASQSPSPEVRGGSQPPFPEVRGASRASKGPRWRYSGTLLVDDGRTSYRYDPAGRLTTMSRRRLSRKPDVWHHVWDARDRLRSVATPDGTTWTYTYDHLGRRLSKTNTATGAVTRFHWHGEQLVEQTESVPDASDAGTNAGLTATTWTFAPYAYTPLAQTRSTETIMASDSPEERNSAPDADVSLNLGSPGVAPSRPVKWTQTEVDREFFAIVTDQIATPTALVDPHTGEVAGHSARTLYGESTWVGSSTPWAFPGQYADSESGLYYNRYRYYQPGTGRYLNPDPLGLTPAPNPHTYPANPTATIDPLGLTPCSGDETVKRYGPHVDGPLEKWLAETFRGGSYTERVSTSPMTLYRTYTEGGRPLGQFWTRTEPSGPLQARIDSALNPEWMNQATAVTRIEVPAGTKYFEGAVAPQEIYAGGVLLGGGNQIVFTPGMMIPNSWIR